MKLVKLVVNFFLKKKVILSYYHIINIYIYLKIFKFSYIIITFFLYSIYFYYFLYFKCNLNNKFKRLL